MRPKLNASRSPEQIAQFHNLAHSAKKSKHFEVNGKIMSIFAVVL